MPTSATGAFSISMELLYTVQKMIKHKDENIPLVFFPAQQHSV